MERILVSEQSSATLKITGTLQGKVLTTLIEGPSSGVDLMKRLNLSSPGTIYPVLKSLMNEEFIEYAPEGIPGKKMYVLSEKGKEQLKFILLGLSRRFLTHYAEPYSQSFIDSWENLIEIEPNQKVLCTLDYKPIKQWLKNAVVTYLPVPEQPIGTFDHIICTMVGTLILYGWERNEIASYLSEIVKSLKPKGTLLIAEVEKSHNMFMEIFFKEVLGYGKVPGISKEELKDLMKSYNMNVKKMLSWKGLLVSIATKPE
jgi:DNA-binding PadR family transcriptional regulator